MRLGWARLAQVGPVLIGPLLEAGQQQRRGQPEESGSDEPVRVLAYVERVGAENSEELVVSLAR